MEKSFAESVDNILEDFGSPAALTFSGDGGISQLPTQVGGFMGQLNQAPDQLIISDKKKRKKKKMIRRAKRR